MVKGQGHEGLILGGLGCTFWAPV